MAERQERTNDDDDKIFPSKNLLKRIVSTKAESKHGNRKGKTKRGDAGLLWGPRLAYFWSNDIWPQFSSKAAVGHLN